MFSFGDIEVMGVGERFGAVAGPDKPWVSAPQKHGQRWHRQRRPAFLSGPDEGGGNQAYHSATVSR